MPDPASELQQAGRRQARPGDVLEVPEHAVEAFALIAGGDNVAARAEAARLLASGEEAERAAGELAAGAVRPDPWALRTAGLATLLVVAVAWAALLPAGNVRAARRLVAAVAESREPDARALFSEAGWGAGGRRLYEAHAGQQGSAYALSQRAADLGFVMVSFPALPGGGAFVRRYLLFDRVDGRIRSVQSVRPRPTDK